MHHVERAERFEKVAGECARDKRSAEIRELVIIEARDHRISEVPKYEFRRWRRRETLKPTHTDPSSSTKTFFDSGSILLAEGSASRGSILNLGLRPVMIRKEVVCVT